MRIVVFGLGYVGSTMIACLLEDGHTVAGVDLSHAKSSLVGGGRSPIVEPGVEAALMAGHADGRLTAATEVDGALDGADLAIVCVGTPTRRDGGLNLSQVAAVANDIGTALRRRPADLPPLLVVVRSTIPPGTMEGLVLPALAAAAGEGPGGRWEAVFNPEFLREGTAIADYRNPPKIVIGRRTPGVGERLLDLYRGIDAPVFELDLAEAEFVKFADNGFHATKVAFANEVGRLCLEHRVDPQRVMDVFLSDTKLNVSGAYLRPGGAFGGSCLPKDVACLVTQARRMGLRTPLLEALIPSNELHKEYLTRRVLSALHPGRRVLQLGLSFKAGTDDLRESPLVYLAHTLLEEGCDLSIHDPDVRADMLLGANRWFAWEKLPDLADHLVADLAAVPTPDLIIFGKRPPGPLPAHLAGVPQVNLFRLSQGDAGRPQFLGIGGRPILAEAS